MGLLEEPAVHQHIYMCYIFFRIFVYSLQGQFAYNPATQGLSPYTLRTACNIMHIATGLISACLYSNIGIKVAYVEVLQEFLHFPPLTSVKGKVLWIQSACESDLQPTFPEAQ